MYNLSLSNCHIQSICDYLTNPNGTIIIHDNENGCNSKEEIEEACATTGLSEKNSNSYFSIYPNPATKEIFISTNNDVIITEVNIYNQFGQRLIHENQSTNMIDVYSLMQGIYVIELISNDIKIREKLIIR